MKSLAASTRRRLVRSKPCSSREQKNRPAIPFLQKATTTHKRCDSLPMIVLTSLPFALASFVRMAPFFSLVLACWRGASHTTRGKVKCAKTVPLFTPSPFPLSPLNRNWPIPKALHTRRIRCQCVARSGLLQCQSRYEHCPDISRRLPISSFFSSRFCLRLSTHLPLAAAAAAASPLPAPSFE